MDSETGIETTAHLSGVWAHGGPPPMDLSTLIHFCRFHASGKNAAAPAFTHVQGAPGEHDRLTFASLDARARAIAAEIGQRGGAGKPVLVVLDPGADYAAALFGCLYARAIAVPIYPPQMLRLQHTLPRLEAVIANAEAHLMLSDRATIGDSLSSLWRMPASSAIAIDEIDPESAQRWDGRLPKPDDVAVLQYTSGSTGNPRGVILTHRILLSNLHAVVEHIHFEGARSVQWVPPYHDMGLIGGILLPIYRGVETVIISPTDFVRDPLLWLRCIDHYEGTSNGAPNFGYELCVRRVDHADCEGLDLRRWKVAIAGAEPVRASTLRRFEEKFARYGFAPTSFCPAFGMAETVVMATGSRLGEPYRTFHADRQALQLGHVVTASPHAAETGPDTDAPKSATKELVSSGVPVEGMSYEIVDPQTCLPLPDGQIGEIWMRGSSVAAGYWREEAATQHTFHARLAAPMHGKDSGVDADARYLRTGDLAARVDGELIVTGRLKELIIVAGRNFYPHDIEQIVQSTSEAFKPDTGAVIGVDVEDTEQMIAIQEFSRPKKFNAEELLQTVVATIVEEAQVTPHAVVLVRSGSLPKTSSGKLRRSDTREMFLRGELIEIARWQSGDVASGESLPFESPQGKTETALAAIWSRVLNVETISRSDDFFSLGGSSLLIAQMLIEVGEVFLVSVPLAGLFQHSTLGEFASLIDSASAQSPDPLKISHSGRSHTEPHPLSAAQQRFWLLDQLGQTNAFVHVPCTIELDEEVDLERLHRALDDVIERHPMLRTHLVETEQGVQQIVSPTASLSIERLGRSDSDGSARNSHTPGLRESNPQTLTSERERFLHEPMKLDQAPLMRVALSPGVPGRSRIDIVVHHAVCDAQSMETLLADLAGFYQPVGSKLSSNKKNAATSLGYLDYAAWDNSKARRERIQTRLPYWQQRLAGMSSELSLPRFSADHREHGPPACEPVTRPISASLGKQIERVALDRGLTPSMVYLTALQTVLSRYGGSEDFGITVPTSNRPASELSGVVGCFVNPVVYRAGVDRSQAIDEALTQTRDRLLADLEHADVPFQDVVAALDLPRDVSRMPLSQVMFLYQAPMQVQKLQQLGDARILSVRPGYSGVTAYDLSLVVHPGEQPELMMIAGERIEPELAERMMASMVEVLEQIVRDATRSEVAQLLSRVEAATYNTPPAQREGSKNERRASFSGEGIPRTHPSTEPSPSRTPGRRRSPPPKLRSRRAQNHATTALKSGTTSSQRVGDLVIPAREERKRIESASYGQTLTDLVASTLVARLRQHAESRPEQIAVRDDAVSLSYGQINDQSDRIALALIQNPLAEESLIGVSMSRGVDAIIAILGIWKAGLAYVPLAPDLPVKRREQIITAANLSSIIDDVEFARLSELASEESVESLPAAPAASALAYVMFTSGSTGVPKGVSIQHSSVTNLLASFAEEPGFTAEDSMLAVTTFSFDISVLELFLPLWCGGGVCMTKDRISEEPESVIAAIERFQPTVIQSTPSALRMLLSAQWTPASSARLLCGGEPMMSDLARDLLAFDCELWNVYGPTETTVWSTIGRVKSAENLSIGHPIGGTICRVVDAHGQLAPLGVAGELQIGGLGVARGYLGDLEQTQARFINDPNQVSGGQRFYKTGDQVRRLLSGDLEFLARDDRQIKLRGFRIELDEIEAALQQCPGVDRAAVMLHRQDARGGERIVAFCCGGGESQSAYASLTERLPGYMIPTTITWLDEMPRTPAGKTDYRSLPVDSLTEAQASSSPPQSPLETALAELWCEVLECSTVGRNDSFFDLGGNSLIAAQLFARLRQRFDVNLPLREIYLRPTIATLAEAIVTHQTQTNTDDLTHLLEQIDSLSEEDVIRTLGRQE